MSATRGSNFYDEVQEAVRDGLKAEGYQIPAGVIERALSDLFDNVAIHVWSRPDVYRVAWEAGWPISQSMADEILSDVEAHVDSEYGITWLTFENAVQDFFAALDWGRLDPLEEEQCIGFFLICDAQGCPNAAEAMLHLERVSLAEALKKAERLAKNSARPAACYSLPKGESPSSDAEWLAQYAHKLFDLHPKEEKKISFDQEGTPV